MQRRSPAQRRYPRSVARRLRICLAGLGAAAVALLFAACGASTQPQASAATGGKCKNLNLLTWEGYADPSFTKGFEQSHHVTIHATYISSASQLTSKLAYGGSGLYDVVTVSGDNVTPISKAGLIQPLNVNQLSASHAVYPFLLQHFQTGQPNMVWAIPQDWGINPFLYNTKAVTNKPTSWNVLWSPSLRGKIAMYDDPQSLSIGAAVLGYNDPYNMTPAQLNAVKSKMSTLKPQVRALWSSAGDLINLFSTHAIDASLGWNYMYTVLHGKNFPISQLVFPNHGGFSWSDANALPKGLAGPCKQMAIQWIDYLATPKVQAQIAKVNGYGPAVGAAIHYMSPALISGTLMNHPEANFHKTIFITEPSNPQL